MPILTVLRGFPGSGKSTIAREIMSSEPNTMIVSMDDFRKALAGGSKKRWHVICDAGNRQALEAIIARLAHDARSILLDAGVNVISDAQHVTRRSCMDEVRQAERHGAVSRIIDCGVELKLDDLIARNETRPIDD